MSVIINNDDGVTIAEYRERWLDGLRSGRYEQASNVLRSKDNGFCCMGVACDVVDSSEWSTQRQDNGAYLYGPTCNDMFPPRDVQLKMGMLPEACSHLAYLNDEAQMSFEQIASVLRHEWLHYHDFPNFWTSREGVKVDGIVAVD